MEIYQFLIHPYRDLAVAGEGGGAATCDELLEGDNTGDDEGQLTDDERLGGNQTDHSQDDGITANSFRPTRATRGKIFFFSLPRPAGEISSLLEVT